MNILRPLVVVVNNEYCANNYVTSGQRYSVVGTDVFGNDHCFIIINDNRELQWIGIGECKVYEEEQ
jgi:hypothetical protein